MSTPQGPLSGFRDMLAQQMIPRQQMLDIIKNVYESYGFTPLKTPALERYETLSGKYGDEGDKLMYKFEDQGGREVALRYDLTVPLARVVGQYGSQLPMPYKRYALGEVWRGERAQAGRYREFTQFDADIVGTESPVADAEMIAMMSDAMAEILKNLGQKAAMVASEYLDVQGGSADKLQKLARIVGDSEAMAKGVEDLSEVFRMLEAAGYSEKRVIFDQAIARGLDYYTGIIFETSLNGAEGLGSVCSGGRYDNLVKSLGGPDLPAVGTSIGVDRLFDGLQLLDQLKAAKTNTQVLIANFDSAGAPEYMKIATKLRKAGIATEIYYEPAKLGKQVGFADKLGIPYVVLIGADEQDRGVATIRAMDTGKQIEVPVSGLSKKLQSLAKPKK